MIQAPQFWILLAAATVVYWLLPARLRLGFLAIASAGYLASLDPLSVAGLTIWSLVFYVGAGWAGTHKERGWVTPALILGILAYLAYFKYIPPLLAAFQMGTKPESLLIPLGISFYSFKLIHYAVEVRRGNTASSRLWSFLCWLYLFPIFTAGPIERFDHFLTTATPRFEHDHIVCGLTRISHGLIKKFVIADLITTEILRNRTMMDVIAALDGWPAYKVWAFLLLTFITLYLDFSAYSDIAIGSARLFGLRIMENFRWPIIAASIGDFWKRWHMTLAGWCQAYVYMPMIGLTRNPRIAIYCTFLVMGLWHAGSLNYICWALYHATGVTVHLAWSRFKRRRGWTWPEHPLLRPIGIAATLAFVSGANAFTLTLGHGVEGSFRVLAKALFIDLPH